MDIEEYRTTETRQERIDHWLGINDLYTLVHEMLKVKLSKVRGISGQLIRMNHPLANGLTKYRMSARVYAVIQRNPNLCAFDMYGKSGHVKYGTVERYNKLTRGAE